MMEKKLVLKYFALALIFLGLVVSLYFLKNVSFTGFAVFFQGPGEGQTTVMLQEADSDNSGDAYVKSAGDADKNFGTSILLKTGGVARIYLRFNISAIPVNQNIDNATLCLYITNTKKTQLLNVSHVYVGWQEDTITWNNQPCGTGFDNSADCNLTSESFVQMDSGFEYTWLCWNVADMVGKEYDAGNKNVSMILYTSDADINSFYSKEYSDSSLWPYLNITYHTADLIPPNLSIVFPVEGDVYNYNESINLNFTVADSYLETCWYALDNGQNTTISGCQNTTFNISEGSHTLYLYANDTLGNLNSSSVNFSIDLSSPSISLNFPSNNFFVSSQQVEFKYTPVDANLQACELWGNFTGSWDRNQTDVSVTSGQINSFSLNLNDESYLWSVWCNDSLGQSNFSANQSFSIDTANPNLTLLEPTGTKTSRAGIPASWNASDLNLQACWYNVYRGASVEIINTTVNCTENSTSFDVTVDADFTFNFYVNDSAGNLNSSSSSFTVSTTTSSPSSGGGGGGGGGGITSPIITPKGELNTGWIGDIIVNPGDTKTLTVSVKNIGGIFLNKCKLEGKGTSAGMISSKDVKGLSVGQEEEFIFTLNVPENFSEGRVLEITIKCEEAETSRAFKVFLSKNVIEADILSTEQKKNKFNFVYLLREKTGQNQKIRVKFWLENTDGLRLVENEDSFALGAGAELKREATLSLPKQAGEFVLTLELTSNNFTSTLEEPVLIGNSVGLFGRAIFIAGGEKALSIAVLAIAALFIIIYFVRKYIVKKSSKEKKAGYVKIKSR